MLGFHMLVDPKYKHYLIWVVSLELVESGVHVQVVVLDAPLRCTVIRKQTCLP